jgi:hypothetical protein
VQTCTRRDYNRGSRRDVGYELSGRREVLGVFGAPTRSTSLCRATRGYATEHGGCAVSVEAPRRATLSVCCIANSTGPFLRAALSPLREIADEVVIAVGGPVPEEDLRYYGEIADQLFSIEFEFIERHLAWLHAQCRGDWILRLDGDEIPTSEMIAEVLTSRDDRRLSSVLFARRNLFPTVESYIVQEPWYPDFQVRMVRNDGSLRFAGLMHSATERTLPARMVEAPMYHLPFILGGIEDRRARAARYEQLRPGMLAPTELPANDMLLPESLPPPLTASVPAKHRRHIEAVLSASGSAPRGLADAVPVSLAEMDAFWSNRLLLESAYRATIEVIGALVPLSPFERRPLYLRVRNEGDESWGWDPSIGPYLHVVHRLLDEGLAPMEDWRPSFFTEWVRPGMTTIVSANLDAPSDPGRYLLEIRVRHSPEERLFGSAQEVELIVRPGGAWGASRIEGAP